MKIKLIDKVICRTPAFCLNDKMADVLEELKVKIQESSPAFYQFISSLDQSELDQLTEKTRFTLWKYFNRAKYRSTPFGSFAAITTLPLAFKSKEPVVIEKEMITDHFIDWSHKEHHLKNLKHALGGATLLLSNSSIYFVGKEIRYIKINENFHELAAVNAIPELSAILHKCKHKIPCLVIYELMEVSFDMNEVETSDLLVQLVNMQLLITEHFPNITGTDYFERLKIDAPKTPNDYIIAKRKHLRGAFNGDLLKHVPEWFMFLNHHLGTPDNADLRNFKRAFAKRFEHQEVSLALIMDPEIGVGYGNLAQQHGANPLVNEIKQAKSVLHQDTIAYGEFHAFLLNKIVEGQAILLEEFVTAIKPKAELPNTFSIIFHLYQSQPVLAFAGGCTANALIGRFTMGNQELEDFGKEVAAFEMKVNEDVVFFDIAYQAEKRVDNVNRRKILYQNELPILTWSDLPHPLDFNDILVSVLGDEVILKSKRLGKRIVPRIPSAYNYTRSDLAAYRFLCDIQSQGLSTNLGFKLQELFPKLSYYPRLSYKGIIVSPAMWRVPSGIYADNKIGITQGCSLLKEWLQKNNINFRYKAGYSDHTLCFDPNEAEDIWAFINFCKQQQEEIYITEALISNSDGIKDEKGGIYLPQYIASYKHEDRLYQAIATPTKAQQKHDRIKLPGGDWLYFELYCHPAKTNHLLLKNVSYFLKSHKKQTKKWFFIRYNEPSNHIRLRLHLIDKEYVFMAMEALKAIIEPEMHTGTLIDYKIKTYFRETDRYGIQRIDLVEQFFFVDSKFILHLLKKSKSENHLILSCLRLLMDWLDHSLSSLADQVLFVKHMSESFAAETVIGPRHFKKINSNFNALKEDAENHPINIPVVFLNRYRRLLEKMMQTSHHHGEREKLLADLIHMHINRLFSIDQRMYETIIYHYLLRMLQTKKAILKQL